MFTKFDGKLLSLIVMSALVLITAGACTPGPSEAAPIASAAPVDTPATSAPASQPEDVAPPPQPAGAEPVDPGAVVDTFYTWYLAYEGNVLVDGAYHDAPEVSPALAQDVDNLIASFDKGGYDPFLCAQDVPSAVTVSSITVSGDTATALLASNLEGHTFAVELRRVSGAATGWQITGVKCGASTALPEPEEPAAPETPGQDGPRAVVADWPVYVDPDYHFIIQYPAGWTYADVAIHAPDKPPAGNMERLVIFTPEGWDEAFIALQFEVYEMDDETFARELPPATGAEEIVRDDGVTYTKLIHEFGEFRMLQYLFRSPSNPEVRVIFTDYLTGWPDRLAGHEAVAETFAPMLASFGFTE